MGNGMQPVGLALVVCDAIHVDSATGKRTLLGTFSAIDARVLPVIIPSIAVYVVLTEYQGILPLVVRIIDVNEEREPVAIAETDVVPASPLDVLEIDFEFADLEFPTAGEYRVQLLMGGAIVSERRLMIELLPAEPSAEEGNDEQ